MRFHFLITYLPRQAVDDVQAILDLPLCLVCYVPNELLRQAPAQSRWTRAHLLCSLSPAAQEHTGTYDGSRSGGFLGVVSASVRHASSQVRLKGAGRISVSRTLAKASKAGAEGRRQGWPHQPPAWKLQRIAKKTSSSCAIHGYLIH